MFRPEQMKILLVDDVAANLDVLRDTLQPVGYQLAVARNGAMALKVAERFQPDLILLDVMMDDMDGFEVNRRLREVLPELAPRVIFVTARGDVDDILKGFEGGCVDYITKPFRQEEVCVRVHTHLELRQANRRLVALNEQRQRWLGMVAHDLRGPLSGIAAYTDLMLARGEALSAEQRREFLELINSTAHQMVSQVDDLLDMTVIAQGRLVLQVREQSLSPLIEERLKLFRLRAEMKHQEFSFQAERSPPFPFDPNRITQVVDNLVGNALKFSPAHSVVELQLDSSPEAVRVRVCDRGPGLPEGQLSALPGAGGAGENQPTGGEKSTGIGLAIAHRIMAAHGGTLSAVNRPGGGACFEFSLPSKGPPDRPDPVPGSRNGR